MSIVSPPPLSTHYAEQGTYRPSQDPWLTKLTKRPSEEQNNHMQISVMLVMMLLMMCTARFLALCVKLIKGRTLVQKEVVEFTSVSQEWWEKRPLTPEWSSYSFYCTEQERQSYKEIDRWINERQLYRWPFAQKTQQKVQNDQVWMKAMDEDGMRAHCSCLFWNSIHLFFFLTTWERELFMLKSC